MNLENIFISAAAVQKLMNFVSHLLDDAELKEFDDYCEESGLNFDNPEYETFYWRTMDRLNVVQKVLQGVINEELDDE